MKKPLLFKFIMMGVLTLLLMIPIMMIDGLIRERSMYRASVLEDIARSSSKSQTITGPILVIPFTKTVSHTVPSTPTGKAPSVETKTEQGYLYFLPTLYRADAELSTEIRRRGIYEALLYHSKTKLSGHYKVPHHFGVTQDYEQYDFHTPFISMGISDIRGIENSVVLTVGDQQRTIKPGNKILKLGPGIHANLSKKAIAEGEPLKFSMEFRLQGTSQLSFMPIGEETYIRVGSDWPHPSFKGEHLPTESNIGAEGFNAHWHTTYFSTNFQQKFNDCIYTNQCGSIHSRAIGIDFVDPGDQYVKSDRATKYALLFIVLIFAGFFLFEVLKALKVHPIQYGLVGAAIAIFYLLLLSLSEHMTFIYAYLISAAACIMLIGYYIVHILQSFMRAVAFSAGLALLYAILYGLLGSEDYALLMGSILLFAVLGTFMLLTRKLDWYSFGKQEDFTPIIKANSSL